jgi:phosphohistidine phosphatase
MKNIIFIRHGRAEELAPEITDFERSLTLKGKMISKVMARKLKEKINSPGLMITSPAFRALETAYIFGGEFGIDHEKILINNILYYKMNIHYLNEILSIVNENIDTVALFGHNPAFTEIADRLGTENCDFIPKTGIVGLSFKVNKWSEIKNNTGKLEYFLKPEKTI